MKKALALVLCFIMIIPLFTGCKPSKNNTAGKLSVVTTIFPIYDWVREITGGCSDIDLSLLIDNGVDIHSFQPSAEDIIKISACDMFIYVGGESDNWVTDALKEKVNKDMVVINLLDILGSSAKDEKKVEGMEAESDDAPETDEHVWLSLRNAEKFCSAITEKLKTLCPKDKAEFEADGKAYINKLEALDKSYKNAVDGSKNKTMVFGDRFPFLYLAEDYGLSYYAAFSGCSAETEASFKTIAFLAGKVDEYKLKSILKIETSDGSVAETIRSATKAKNQRILTLDSMQSKTSDDIKNNVTYILVMDKNLRILKKALEQV